MISLEIAPRARRDLDSIFTDSHNRFGALAAVRYRRLVAEALRDLRLSPNRLGVAINPDLPTGLRLYHLRYSRSAASGRIGRPRHLIAFKVTAGGLVVVRVLHDAMDIPRHLSAESRA